MTFRRRSSARAFTLTELLIVVAIMAIMASIAIPALKGINGASQFTKATRQVAAACDLARSYAIGQNTYVWLSFYTYQPTTPPGASPVLYVSAFASLDGTDSIGIGQSVTIVYPPPQPDNYTPIFPILSFPGVTALTPEQASTQGIVFPNSTSVMKLANPLKNTTFAITRGAISLGGDNVLAVVEFLPSGAVQVDADPGNPVLIPATAIVLQPYKGGTQVDKDNVATVWLNGLTGLTTVYRK